MKHIYADPNINAMIKAEISQVMFNELVAFGASGLETNIIKIESIYGNMEITFKKQ